LPSLPELPGRFEGDAIHSCGYKSPEIFRGRRVLIVGAGNSGCDIAVEASQFADRTFLSLRRGYHVIPKYAFGRPDFYLHVFHPTRDDLFILGMLQPDSGVWPLMDLQARAVAGCLRAARAGGPAVARVRALRTGPRPDLGGGIRYVKSERHRYEVEHSTYARHLKKLIRVLGS
jgi:cation diffusion facilitator CzcD-associated flavoprotein CzcO